MVSSFWPEYLIIDIHYLPFIGKARSSAAVCPDHGKIRSWYRIKSTYCFLHQQIHVTKKLSVELHIVLNDVINFHFFFFYVYFIDLSAT